MATGSIVTLTTLLNGFAQCWSEWFQRPHTVCCERWSTPGWFAGSVFLRARNAHRHRADAEWADGSRPGRRPASGRIRHSNKVHVQELYGHTAASEGAVARVPP